MWAVDDLEVRPEAADYTFSHEWEPWTLEKIPVHYDPHVVANRVYFVNDNMLTLINEPRRNGIITNIEAVP